MAFETQVKEGGAWRSGLLVSGKDGGAWRDIQEIWAREAGAWRQVYVRSDPLEQSWYPTWTGSYIEADGTQPQYTFANPTDDVIQGDWDTVGHPSGTQRATGLINFSSSDTGWNGRTVTLDVDLRLRVQSQYTSNGIYPRIALWGTNEGTEPTSIGAHSSSAHGSYQTTGARTTDENDVTTDLPNGLGDDLIDGSRDTIVLHDWGDGTGSADKEYYRGTFHGTPGTTSERPQITIEADYV